MSELSQLSLHKYSVCSCTRQVRIAMGMPERSTHGLSRQDWFPSCARDAQHSVTCDIGCTSCADDTVPQHLLTVHQTLWQCLRQSNKKQTAKGDGEAEAPQPDSAASLSSRGAGAAVLSFLATCSFRCFCDLR